MDKEKSTHPCINLEEKGRKEDRPCKKIVDQSWRISIGDEIHERDRVQFVFIFSTRDDSALQSFMGRKLKAAFPFQRRIFISRRMEFDWNKMDPIEGNLDYSSRFVSSREIFLKRLLGSSDISIVFDWIMGAAT